MNFGVIPNDELNIRVRKAFSSSTASSNIQLLLENSINSHNDDENEYKYFKEAESKDDNSN